MGKMIINYLLRFATLMTAIRFGNGLQGFNYVDNIIQLGANVLNVKSVSKTESECSLR